MSLKIFEVREKIKEAEEKATAERIQRAKEQEYHNLVVNLIREKYSANNEFAILRQSETKPFEFEEYNAYCEECKAKARTLVFGGSE